MQMSAKREKRTRFIARTAIFAALYTALVIAFYSISYLEVQLRLANILMGLVPVFGYPAIAGIALGVLITGFMSPLRLIDAVSALPSLVGLLLIYLLRKVSVFLGLTLYSLIISVWVSYMIALVYRTSFFYAFMYTFIGTFIATTILGYIVYKAYLRATKHV